MKLKDFFCIPPEIAHWLMVKMIKANAIKSDFYSCSDSLSVKVMNATLRSPVGLAAGFDKNGAIINEMFNFGFGFIEVGTVTKRAQSGNARPRVFRLSEDLAIINRLGFNNSGVKVLKKNINCKSLNDSFFGINIGCNYNSPDRIADYVYVIEELYGLSDYIAINISSPNTNGLRRFQNKDNLALLMTAIMKKRKLIDYASSVPIFIKISPDMSMAEIDSFLAEVLKYNICGLIISNTTIGGRKSLKSKYARKAGGLSGKPLFERSNRLLVYIYKKLKEVNHSLVLIGVGGIFSAEDAYEKIKCGATLIQIYTAIAYNGLGIVNQINAGLMELLERDGLNSVSEAVGVNC